MSPALPDCCDPSAYGRFFDEKEAERSLRSYRRKGLDPMASSMVGYLKSRGVEGADVLEVGGGVGAIQVELLKAGARQCLNVELSPGYDGAARRLATEEGLGDRVSTRFGDFVELSEELEPADVVVMNRVVCCYPWMERLVGAAAAKTGSYLAIVVPKDKWWVRLGLRVGDMFRAMRRDYIPAYVHPVDGIESVASKGGLVVRHSDTNLIWQAEVFERVG
jgi:protein-L-isoaspartate O-methyltransferase